MVYRQAHRKTYQLMVRDLSGESATLTTGTTSHEEAEDVEAFVRLMRRQRQRVLLAALVSGDAKLPEAYDAHVAGRLPEFIANLADADLSPLVDEWAGRGRRGASSAKYVKQVRSFIPKGERFPRSRFRRKEIAGFLDSLAVSGSTQRKYKAALMQFGHWLVEREVIEANPVRDVKGASVPRKRHPTHLTHTKYVALVEAADDKWRPLFALLYGTGMEIGAALRVRRSDVDAKRKTVYAWGSKNEYREREVAVDAWAWPHFWRHAQQFFGDNPLFVRGTPGRSVGGAYVGYSEAGASRMHGTLLARKEYAPMRMHNARHSFAIHHRRFLRSSDAWIANQLGHADETMVRRTYGRFKPDPIKDRATTQVTTRPEKLREASRAR